PRACLFPYTTLFRSGVPGAPGVPASLSRRARMGKHLLVVEGPDKDRHFPLGDTGILVIGTSHRHAEICLHDLHTARSHCEVELRSEEHTSELQSLAY